MMFFHHNKGKVAILIVYVDDIILTGDDLLELAHLKAQLTPSFEVKDLDSGETVDRECYQCLIGRLIYLSHTRLDIDFAIGLAPLTIDGLLWAISSLLFLFCDNKAVINIANNPMQHDRTKYIEVDRYFIKEKLDQRIICLHFVKSSEQLANILTKGLSTSSFSSICNKMGLHDIFVLS
ncbi:uncharacterized protein [Elaeis guineensis]|uniref:uncharacterized protein n=1 Tax=Elaeis guineensis var. tenera TaxID=51953 RepID=UPI003C6CD365